MGNHFLPFLGLITVLVAIPGPAVTLTMKNAVARGRRLALMTALGVVSLFSASSLWCSTHSSLPALAGPWRGRD